MPMRPHPAPFASVIALAALVAALAPVPAPADVPPATPTFLLAWGTPGAAPGQFNNVFATATDGSGNVYAVDRTNNRVEKFDPFGNLVTTWGAPGAANGQFNQPSFLAVDASGNVFVTDGGNNRVQKFASDGTYLAQWGGAGTGNGQFNFPYGIATDASGNVYVSDNGNNRVQKFTGAGAYVVQWGSSGSGTGQFTNPSGVATDASGNVFVADQNRIQKFTSSGTFVLTWGSLGSGNGQFNFPNGVATDVFGNVYVTEFNNNRVQKFTNGGTYLTQWGSAGSGSGQFNQPVGDAVDAAGNVYVADESNNRIQKFSGAGAPRVTPSSSRPYPYVGQIGAAGSGTGQYLNPWGVAVDALGNVYAVDNGGTNKVIKYGSTGAYLTSWGGPGASSGLFNNPQSAAVDAAGNVYVADTGNNRIQKFTNAGVFVTAWGTVGSANGQFSAPGGVAVDAAGNVYVADTGNHRVQKFTSVGAFVTKWGTSGFSGNGTFQSPNGIGVDPSGNVFVCDIAVDLVQKFTAAGTWLLQWGTPGSGNGSFQNPYGLGCDVLGNVYVTDQTFRIQKFDGNGSFITVWSTAVPAGGGDPFQCAADLAGNVYVADGTGPRIQKYAPPGPRIALVSDFAIDQGGQAQLRVLASPYDVSGSASPISGYEIYRRNDPLPTSALAMPALSSRPTGIDAAGYTYVGSFPASGETEYSAVAPTLANATAALPYYSAFMVRAVTADPLTFYDSTPENGWSIDNIPPGTPNPFTAAYFSHATSLHWGLSGASDFASFRLYRGSSSTFTPGAGNLIATTTDTGYVDPGAAGSWYKLSAVDLNGNESTFAVLGPAQTTDVPGGPPVGFALEGVRPNPASALALTVRFALASNQAARLELVDVAGRVVAARNVGALGIGAHTIDLADGTRWKPGLYFVRLRQGSNERVTRVTVLP